MQLFQRVDGWQSDGDGVIYPRENDFTILITAENHREWGSAVAEMLDLVYEHGNTS